MRNILSLKEKRLLPGGEKVRRKTWNRLNTSDILTLIYLLHSQRAFWEMQKQQLFWSTAWGYDLFYFSSIPKFGQSYIYVQQTSFKTIKGGKEYTATSGQHVNNVIAF